MKNKDLSFLVVKEVKEVKKVVDEKFRAYTSDILKVLKNYGFTDFKALGLASDVSSFLAKTCVTREKYFHLDELIEKTENVKKEYLKNFEERISKKQRLTYDDILHASETLINLLQDEFDVSFSVSHMLPGCFGRSSKKEKY